MTEAVAILGASALVCASAGAIAEVWSWPLWITTALLALGAGGVVPFLYTLWLAANETSASLPTRRVCRSQTT